MSENGHRSLERALDIIEFVSHNKDNTRLSDISKALDIPKGSCFALVKTLTSRKYLIYDSKTASYSLGFKILEIVNSYLVNSPINTSIYELIRNLSTQINETVHLAILDGFDIIYIMKHDSSHPIRMNSSIGKRVPAFTTAVGKALLSQYSNEEIKSILSNQPMRRITDHTIVDLNEILQQMDQIRLTSLSTEREESTLGIECIGTVIKNQTGAIVAGLSIAIPSYRSSQHDLSKLGKLLIETAQNITTLLGSDTFMD